MKPTMNRRQLEKQIVGVEITSSAVKLCRKFIHDGRHQYQFLKKDLVSKEDAEISKELRELFLKFNENRTGVLLNLPRYLVIARFVHLPSTLDDEIEKMAKIESASYISHTNEEMIIDHKIIHKGEDGYSLVLIVIVQVSVINRMIAILNNAGLRAKRIALGSESLFNWYMGVLKPGPGTHRPLTQTAALINVDTDSVAVDVIQTDQLVFTRAVSYNAQNPFTSDKVADEIKRTIAIYHKESKTPVDRIYLVGVLEEISRIIPLLDGEDAISTEMISQSENLELSDMTDMDMNGASFIELAGFISETESSAINLLPEKLKKEGQIRFVKKKLMGTLLLLGALVLFFAALAGKSVLDDSRRLAILDKKIGVLELEAGRVKKTKGSTEILGDDIYKKPLAIDVLAEAVKLTPNGVLFQTIDYENAKSLVLKGNAPSMNDVIRFVPTLENSAFFEDVKVRYTTQSQREGSAVVDFEIFCGITESE